MYTNHKELMGDIVRRYCKSYKNKTHKTPPPFIHVLSPDAAHVRDLVRLVRIVFSWVLVTHLVIFLHLPHPNLPLRDRFYSLSLPPLANLGSDGDQRHSTTHPSRAALPR